MKRFFNIIAILFLLLPTLQAQSLVNDLKEVSSILDTAKTVQIQVTCKIYSKRGGELINTANTSVIKKGKLSVSVFDDLAVFTNEKYGVYVNGEDKTLMLVEKSKYTSQMKQIDNKSIDQFVSWVKKQQTKKTFNPVLVSEEKDVRTYSIKGLDDLKEVIIALNIKDKSIVKISYEFNDSSDQKQKYIVLDYSRFLVNSREITLDQSDYYIQQSGKFLPGNKYKSYSITTDL